MQLVLTPELLLEAYRHGLFPMAYSAGSPYVHWICPEMRGQLPIAGLHIPRRLKDELLKAPFEIRIDTAFEQVIRACAARTEHRPETWINDQIIKAYIQMHKRGHAHSIECWQDDELVGGLYGVRMGAAFFGESMFSTCSNASKIALAHTAARLWRGGFKMFDTQFVNDHLRQFGVYELPHPEFKKALAGAITEDADFVLRGLTPQEILEDYLENRKG